MAVTVVYYPVAAVITSVETPLLPASEAVFSPALFILKNLVCVTFWTFY